MVLRNDARRVRDDFLDISLSLPFQADTNTGFGVLAKTYLDSTIAYNEGVPIKEGEGETEDAKDAKEAALESVEENFGGVKNPRAEVERGFRFWDAVSLPSFLSAFAFAFQRALALTLLSSSRTIDRSWSRSARSPPTRGGRTPTRSTSSSTSSTSLRLPRSGCGPCDREQTRGVGRGGLVIAGDGERRSHGIGPLLLFPLRIPMT